MREWVGKRVSISFMIKIVSSKNMLSGGMKTNPKGIT